MMFSEYLDFIQSGANAPASAPAAPSAPPSAIIGNAVPRIDGPRKTSGVAAYEFALASAAIVIRLSNSRIDYARVALGGVGTKPWRSLEAEAVLHGAPADPVTFRRAAEAALKDAHPQSENGYKVELAHRCIIRALTTATQSV